MKQGKNPSRYVLCLRNPGFAASLETRKVYRALPDPAAERRGLIRVVDESGEDYLYPERHFAPVELPAAAARVISASAIPRDHSASG